MNELGRIGETFNRLERSDRIFYAAIHLHYRMSLGLNNVLLCYYTRLGGPQHTETFQTADEFTEWVDNFPSARDSVLWRNFREEAA